jgi:glyoxylase-like metal-dependent hydrolase (beta-lactamase superfamily II)
VQTRALLDQLTMLLFPVGQAYLWRDADGITLVDTGMVGSAQAIERAVRTLGCAPSDVDRVVITHFHDDHAGGAAEVGSWPGVTILAHRCDAPVIRGETPGPPPDLHGRGARAAREHHRRRCAAAGATRARRP